MSELIVREQVAEHVVLLRLNRPERRNAINRAMLGEFETAIDTLVQEDVRVLLVTGAGSAFSAGADLKEIAAFGADAARKFSVDGNRVFKKLADFPCPVIAMINGHALGGGCELACACDLRYASDSASLGQPEGRVGMITGWGGTFRIPEIVGAARARELIFTGRIVPAEEALAIGLVHDVFAHDELLEKTRAVAWQILLNAPHANRLSKQLLRRPHSDTETWINEESLALAYCVTTGDQKEGIQAFLEKREPHFKGV